MPRKKRVTKDFKPADKKYWTERGKTDIEPVDFWECPSDWSREYQIGAQEAYRSGRAERA